MQRYERKCYYSSNSEHKWKHLSDSSLRTGKYRIFTCFPKETEVRNIIGKYEELRKDFLTYSLLPCQDSVLYPSLVCSEGDLDLFQSCDIFFGTINYFTNRSFTNCVVITARSNNLCCNGTLFEMQRFSFTFKFAFICTAHFVLAIYIFRFGYMEHCSFRCSLLKRIIKNPSPKWHHNCGRDRMGNMPPIVPHYQMFQLILNLLLLTHPRPREYRFPPWNLLSFHSPAASNFLSPQLHLQLNHCPLNERSLFHWTINSCTSRKSQLLRKRWELLHVNVARNKLTQGRSKDRERVKHEIW